MCFGSPKPQPQTQAAAAPPPPAPIAEEQDIAAARTAEDEKLFGTSQPTLRVDRSLASGGAVAGGSGLRM